MAEWQIRGLTKPLDGKGALDGVDLHVATGQSVVILGLLASARAVAR